MNIPICIKESYVLRIYASNSILFNHSDSYSYQILNQVETDILKCVDGKRSLPEVINLLCKIYSIDNINERKSEFLLLKKYVDRFFELGVLVYDTNDTLDQGKHNAVSTT